MTRHWSPSYQGTMQLTDHHMAGTKRHLEPNTSPHYLFVETKIQQLRDTHMTCGVTWKNMSDKINLWIAGACPDARQWPSG